MNPVLALDIGGTNCRLCVTDGCEPTTFSRTVPTSPANPYETLETIQQALLDAPEFDAVGIGVAGNVQDGVLTGSGNLPGWKGFDLRQAFISSTDRPSVVLNDCAAAALGEYSEFQQELVYVIWGTGVGVASVRRVNGVIQPLATEMGHMIVNFNSKSQCGCGGFGHLEALVGGGNLKRRFGVEAPQMNGRQWSRVLDDLSVGLYNLGTGNIGLPIVLGGGVAYKQRHRLKELQTLVSAFNGANRPPKLLLARHGEDSGLVGAAYAARQLLTP